MAVVDYSLEPPASSVGWEGSSLGSLGEDDIGFAGGAKGSSKSIGLIVCLSWTSWGGVQAPLGLQRLLNLLRGGELEVASLLGDHGALVSRLQLGHKLGLEAAGLLGVQVANFLWDVNEGSDGLVVALLWALLGNTASSANLDGELLALGVANKLAWLLLDVLGSTARLVNGSALFWTLSVANLLQGLVALLDGFVNSLLLEGDLAGLFKVLLADLLLSWSELRHISVVALFDILVGALKNGILLQGLDSFLLLHAAETSFGVIDATAEVNASLDSSFFLASPPGQASG